MPTTLGRNLHLCFTKIKRPLSPQSSPTPLNSDDHSHRLATSSSIFMKNFNSLYDYNVFDSTFQPITSTHSSASTFSSELESDSQPDFATVVASQRFFFSFPGRSNSIIESTPSLATPESSDTPVVTSPINSNQSSNKISLDQSWNSTGVKDSVAVSTDSPDPYMDFRRSMQEMVEARDSADVKANRDYLHELFLCYLALNHKSTHKFIVGAFADLLVSLMSSGHTVTEGDRQEEEFSAGGGHRN